MASKKDKPKHEWPSDLDLELDPEDDEDDYDEILEALRNRVSELAEEYDLPLGALSPILLELGITTHMMDYALSVEKPSSSGLKLQLDRLQRDFADTVRNSKRSADEFLAFAKEAIERAEAKEEGENQESDENHERASRKR